MSDLTKSWHNFEDMLAGRTDFNGFLAGEGAIFAKNIASAPAAAQPFLQIAFSGFKASASTLVGAGETALGPIINAGSDTQATMLLNAMQAAGIPTGGALLSPAEHAALVTIINGFKAMLDRMHIEFAAPAQVGAGSTAGQTAGASGVVMAMPVSPPSAPAAAPLAAGG